MFTSLQWQKTQYGPVFQNEQSELYQYFYKNQDNQTSKIVYEELKELQQPAFLLHHVLSPEECKALIDTTEKIGYETAASYCHAYRDRYNDRLMSDDALFSQLIWERCKQYLPKTATLPRQQQQQDSKQWNLNSLNNRWRYCKYTKSHYFGAHTDGIFRANANKSTIFTFMLYLNGHEKSNFQKEGSNAIDLPTYSGGCTNFVKYDKNKFKFASNSFETSDADLVKQIIPEPGLAIVFPQESLPHFHEGESLITGTKYILRSDIFYSI